MHIYVIIELFSQNLDSWQLLTKNGDGGDTCSRHFTALYCLPHSRLEAEHALKLLQVNGIPRRHPDTNAWYGHTNRTSRDQLMPYLCYVSVHSSSHFLKLAAQHAKHLFMFTWNTRRNFQYPTLEEHRAKSTPDVAWNYRWKMPDFCFANVWAIYVRGFMRHTLLGKLLSPVLYALLHVLDLHRLADLLHLYAQLAMGRKIGPTRIPNSIDHDMQNQTLGMHHAATNYPTLISYISWKLYKPYAVEGARSFFQQAEEPRLDIAIECLVVSPVHV